MKTGEERPCGFCTKLVYLPLWRLRRNKYHFCSVGCQLKWVHEQNRNTSPKQCLECGKTFQVTKHELTTAKFCSKKCTHTWRSKHNDNWRYGRHHTDETKRKIKESNLANWQNPDFVKEMVKSWARQPTKPERHLEVLLQKHFPQFEYNGDGRLGITLGGLTPDFVNLNGRKEVIEMFGDHYHSSATLGGRWKGSELGKIMVYNSIGYRCLVIWESELEHDEETVVNKVRRFIATK